MIHKIIEKSIEKNFLTMSLSLLFILGGWFAYRSLPIDAIPDITNVQVQVITPAPAQTPDIIEANITYPIENAMNSIPGTTEIRSLTRYGLSHITVIFEDGYDLYRARQMILEKIQSIDLPENIQPTIGPITTGLGEIYHYSLEAKKWKTNPKERLKQLMELRTIQEWDIIPRLLSLRGVTEVNTIGGFPKQFYVKPLLYKMNEYGIHFHELTGAIRKNSYNTGGGFIQQTAENLLVQGTGLIRSIDDIKAIPVKMLHDFRTITIGDVASVAPAKEIRTGAAVVNGKESIIGSVFMLLGSNSRTVSEQVETRIQEIKKSLPSWVKLTTLYNRSNLVNSTLNTVQKNLLYGAFLVILILFLLIGNVRVAVITAITIPLALLGTFIFMKLMNIPGSLMSLGAIDFGIVIDGAVIVMDNCARMVSNTANKKKRQLTRSEIKKVVIQSSIEIRKAAGFGQLIIVIVFLPILALTGIEGKMFKPMAFGFAFALISAFILSFTTIPALAGTFLSGKPGNDDPLLIRLIKKGYLPVLRKSIRYRFVIIPCVAVAVIISAITLSRMGSEFIPKLDEGAIASLFIRPTNTSNDRSIELEIISQKLILKFPEVKHVFSRLGSAEIMEHPAGINHGDTYIILHPKDKWPKINGKRRTKDELAAIMYKTLRKTVPGQRIIFSQPVELRFNELLEGVRSDIALKIFGDNMETLEILSKKAAAIIKSIPGSREVEPEIKGKSPMLSVTPRMSDINRLGISKENVLNAVRIALGGEQAGFLYENVRKFPIYVRLKDSVRKNIHAMKNIPIGVSSGFSVPLQQVADIKIRDLYSSISRESSQRRTAVLINIKDRDMESFISEAKTKIKENLKLPSGYHIQWGGNFKNLQSAKRKLYILVPLTLLLVFLMIYSAFGNVLQTALVFLGIPFAAVGGVVNLQLINLPFSISAAVGFIALSGIAVLNGVVLVSYYNNLKKSRYTGLKLIEQGALVRLRPVMMTALTDILGFLPMMLATGTGAEVQKPLAAVVVGGVFTSTLLTLIMLPLLYNLFEKYMQAK